jgi:hypothetical protein
MNNRTLVKLSNTIGIVSILLLIYWVFIFISIEVFGFKVFRENLTETFYMSVMGILALMFGALIINIMFNLTRIAEKHNLDFENQTKSNKLKGWLLIFSFPIIFLLLFFGDYMTSMKKEKMLVKSAESIISKNKSYTDKLLNYSFTEKYILETSEILDIVTETDDNFPNITVLVRDKINDNHVYLGFNHYHKGNLEDSIQPNKKNFIRKTTSEEREFLEKVFDNQTKEYKYSAHDGDYELFYPVIRGKQIIVLHFSDHQRYGKLGS